PDPVHAILHIPPGETRKQTAVLMCPPFGWEEMCSHRARRAWALTLASAGYLTARIDLPATGNSAGAPSDPGRLDAWTTAVAQAARWLRESTHATRVAVIGIGLGGMLAVRALAQGAPIDDLVLWAVPAKGRLLLREMRAYAGMVAARRPEDSKPETLSHGDLELTGFLLSAETAAALGELDLTSLMLPQATAGRVLMLGRDGLAVDAGLSTHLEHAGASVTIEDTDDYAALMESPQESRTPVQTIAKTIAWLDSGTAGESQSTVPAPGEPRAGTMKLWHAGRPVEETPISLCGDLAGLFGVVSRPPGRERAPVCAVLLNGGALRHIGPSRTWVEIARRWAARGVPTVRIDMPGIGESDGDAREPVPDASFYTPQRTEQTLAILDHLAELGLPDRFVLGGLCSGAYWSLHAALADPRVRGALMINLYSMFWSAELVAERDTRHSLGALRGRAWRRLVNRDLTAAQARTALASIKPSQLRSSAGNPVERAQSEEIERALDRLREQGTHALMLFSRGEGLYDQLVRQRVPERLDRWPNLCIEQLPTSDHMFRAIWLQRHVHGLLDRALDRVLASESG
ncbi:MAG TPA: alpha/beta fold hydrolase, partial [Solirubrobacteraceae bacterium]|nr:alpha/beta fold hydrolase [Solirubrobacteraceae bacterium]